VKRRSKRELSRKFGSRRYWFSSAHATKRVAKEAAKKRRCHGDLVRVVKSVRGVMRGLSSCGGSEGGRSSALRTAHPGLVRDVCEEHRAFSVSVSPFGLHRGSRWGRGRLESFRALSSERPKRRREGKRLIAPSGVRFLPSGR
jgi:hypothetical protein